MSQDGPSIHTPAPASNRGFTLIVVLFSILTLTMLIGIATDRFLSSSGRFLTVQTLALRHHLNGNLVSFGLKAGPSQTEIGPRSITIGGQEFLLTQQMESGLVDLNHAPITLVSRVLAASDLPVEKQSGLLSRLQEFRQSGDVLFDRSELLRRKIAEPADYQLIKDLVTVHSGGAGIYPPAARPEVLGVVFGTDQIDANIVRSSPDATTRVGRNARIAVLDQSRKLLGTGLVRLSESVSKRRIWGLE